ncbi:hypothetical protein D9757_012133 [Collybiopsis confluens]|uniref:Uncharacterized protein n=1 Tax=Collybiopsis confluens TaxID=2823264 RepID=A0A8H5LQ55_9AGAR|nr:hypothetical protein D9757_012133 [Collybiopsis confluens]
MEASRQQQHLRWPSDDKLEPKKCLPAIFSGFSSLFPGSKLFPSRFLASTDVSTIHGNVSDTAKRFVVDFLEHHYFRDANEETFGLDVGRRLRLISMNVWDASSRGVSNGSHVRIPGRATEAQTVFEITVTQDMCNQFDTLDGSCACYIVDP